MLYQLDFLHSLLVQTIGLLSLCLVVNHFHSSDKAQDWPLRKCHPSQLLVETDEQLFHLDYNWEAICYSHLGTHSGKCFCHHVMKTWSVQFPFANKEQRGSITLPHGSYQCHDSTCLYQCMLTSAGALLVLSFATSLNVQCALPK